jgi:hypothetical protein
MIRLLIRTVIFLAAAAIGLLVASQVVDGMTVSASGFATVVVIYAVAQSVLTPFIMKVAAKNATAFMGGVSLVSSYVALLLASIFGSALEINGAGAWIAATVIVWLVTALASFLLPFILVKAGVERARARS